MHTNYFIKTIYKVMSQITTMDVAREYRVISIEHIDTSKTQARQKGIDKNVDSLASSIELQGLFSPVLVVAIKDDRYELIAGQRRMKAYRDILFKKDPARFSKIPVFVYTNLQEWEKKAISINENFNQEPMGEDDKIAAVTACFNEFDNMKTTAKKTGIPYDAVRKYVKFERLPQVLKDLKSDGQISLKTAIDTADLFGFDTSNTDNTSQDEVKKAAKEIETMTPKQIKYVKEVQKETQKPPVQVIDDVRKDPQLPTQRITTEVVSDTYQRIEQYRNKKEIKSIPLAASELIEEGLDKNNI